MNLPFSLTFLKPVIGSLGLCATLHGAPLDDALETIRKAGTVDTEAVGYAAARTKTYDAFETMTRNATREQLMAFTNDPNPNVKAYAAMALKSTSPTANFHPLLMEKLKDRQSFEFLSACSMETLTIADFYYMNLSDNLSKEQREEVIGYLLTHGQGLSSTSEGLLEWEIPERHLPTLRTMARNGNSSALIALAKFRKAEDYPLIIAAAKEQPWASYQAIAMNPQPVYFDLLKETLAAMLATSGYEPEAARYYIAVAAFRNRDAALLLDQALNGFTTTDARAAEHTEHIGKAVWPIVDSVFDSLKWRLWGQFEVLDAKTFGRMKALDEERATKLTRQTLGHLTYRIPNDLLEAMLADMMLKDPAFTQKVIADELRKADVSRYEFFAKLAKESRREIYVEPLFIGVETAENAHVFLAATEAILAYENEVLNQRLAAARKKNPALGKDWGGEAFKKRMMEVAK